MCDRNLSGLSDELPTYSDQDPNLLLPSLRISLLVGIMIRDKLGHACIDILVGMND